MLGWEINRDEQRTHGHRNEIQEVFIELLPNK